MVFKSLMFPISLLPCIRDTREFLLFEVIFSRSPKSTSPLSFIETYLILMFCVLLR